MNSLQPSTTFSISCTNILLSSVHKHTSRTATDDVDVFMLDIHITEISILPTRVPNQQHVVISHI
jgi:hypothetical protein